MKRSLIDFLFYMYKTAAPILGAGACKFVPTCSQYTKEAYHKHPFLKATCLALKRLAKCGPFSKGGFDPVP